MYDSLSNDMKQLTNVSLKPLLSSWTMDTQSISTALATLPQYVFPPQHARIPITPANVLPIALPPLTLYLFLCYLVRRPNTRPIRLALFPVVVPWLWWLTFHVAWFPERTMAWNVPFTTTGVLFVTRAAEYTLSSTPALKLSERTPGDGGPAHSYSRLSPTRPTYLKVYYALSDSNELVQAHRGVGWTFGTGQGLHLPPLQSRRPTAHRGAWLKSTAVYDVMLNYLVVDAINTWWRTVPAITDPRYTPQAYEHLSLPMRVLVPVSVMLVVRSYMSMWYSFAGVLDVLGGAEPSTWPVLFGEPWKATSLHALWSTEWHQLSRHLFLTTLGYPLRALFGTPGLTLGAFASSGLYHNLMLIGDGLAPTYHLPTNAFFLLQALGLVLERAFRQLTGRRVRGWLGALWVWFFVAMTIQPMAKTWLERGYLETSPIHPSVSVFERVVGAFR